MSRTSPESAWATDLEKADMCERLSFPPEDSRHVTVDKLLREYATVLRRGHAQTPASDNPLKAYSVEQLQYEIAWRLADASTGREGKVNLVCDMQALLEIRDFLADIVGGAEVTERSRDTATGFVSILDSQFGAAWSSDTSPESK